MNLSNFSWRQWLLASIMPGFALACGAAPDELPPGAAVLGTAEQEIRKEAGYGIETVNNYTCPFNGGYSGTCLYGDRASYTVWLDPAGMTSAEELFISGALDQVITALNAPQSGFSLWGPDTFDAFTFVRTQDPAQRHIKIAKGATGCSSGQCMQQVSAYSKLVCSGTQTTLTETPFGIPGTHRRCAGWAVTLDVADILGPFYPVDKRDDVARHAIASALLGADGVGLESNTPFYNGDNVNTTMNSALLSVFPVSNQGACRADYAVKGGSTLCGETGCSFGLNNCD